MSTKRPKSSTAPLPVTRAWASRWYAANRNFATMLAKDLEVRNFLKANLKNAAVSRILIERPAKNVRITIFSARPGFVIGKKGEDIERLKAELTRRLGVPVAVNIEEVRKPEVDAQLIADSITWQLEKRIMFRRAMKRTIQNAMRLGAQGIKIMSAGRLNGIEIVRTEWYREGRVPLHTLRADIDYGFSEAKTTYGVIGVKVWVYRGDRLGAGETPVPGPEGRPTERLRRRPVRPEASAGTGKQTASETAFPLLDAANRVESGTAKPIAQSTRSNPGLEVSCVISAPTGRERKAVIDGMPAWVRHQMVTEVTRLALTLDTSETSANLLRAIVTAQPEPIPASSTRPRARFDLGVCAAEPGSS